jgi:uncharacterized hydantoinase/oxoprolinase family protein
LFNAGKPSLVCVTENFSELASEIAQSREVPEIPRVVIRKDVELLSDEELKEVAESIIDQLMERLVQ